MQESTFLIRAILATALLLSLPIEAYAYLDPATGSAIIQGLIAAASAALVTGHLYWSRVSAWFRSFGKKEERKSEPGEMSGNAAKGSRNNPESPDP